MQANDKLKTQNQTLQAKLDDANEKQTKTQKNLEMAKSMINDLKALQGDIKQLKKSAAEGESTKTELERICEQRDKYEAELRVALEDKDKLSEQYRKLKTVATEMQVELTQSIKTNADKLTKVNDLTEEVKVLKTREKDAESIIKNLEGSIARLK